MKAERLPKKITPCPIGQAVVEVRFESDVPRDAVVGMAYERFKAEFPTMEKLPLLQLPDPILSQDPDLKFKAHYRLKGPTEESAFICVGPSVLSINTGTDYPGWAALSAQFKGILSKFETANIANKVTRLGIRYTNLFEFNICDQIVLKISDGSAPFVNDDILIRTVIKSGDFKNILLVSNQAKWKVKDVEKTGSVIDIDTHYDTPTTIEELRKSLLDSAHKEEKQLFFGLIDPKFLAAKLQPEY
jgi:uncharacterized protein (TIGR04255 family)